MAGFTFYFTIFFKKEIKLKKNISGSKLYKQILASQHYCHAHGLSVCVLLPMCFPWPSFPRVDCVHWIQVCLVNFHHLTLYMFLCRVSTNLFVLSVCLLPALCWNIKDCCLCISCVSVFFASRSSLQLSSTVTIIMYENVFFFFKINLSIR